MGTKKVTVGILAHVDAGKTTLAEAILYRTGMLRRLGRVDHQDAFLDTDAMERARGITIFSKQAKLELGDFCVTLLDTPGHVDFSAEMERTLQVLDYAALDNNNAVQPGGNERSRAFSTLYCGGDFRVLKLPFCSPCFATDEMLKNNPTTLVINAGHCPFREVNETYAMRLAAVGCEVTIQEYLESPHGFTVRMAGQWQQAQQRIIRAIREAHL